MERNYKDIVTNEYYDMAQEQRSTLNCHKPWFCFNFTGILRFA